ncbi:BGTF surface domain-containing protein [Halobiforma nitratireducens]|uniref:BGTF surface domain-containing protein n=1 Tax=Halobiforma nitratireducens TaxID=130048 RepID=UPI001267A3F6|nr:BGTF surface domain-containing protein [Halobiforma nitratireducens]
MDRTYDSPDELSDEDVWIGQEIAITGLNADSVGAAIRGGFPSENGSSIETAPVSGETAVFETDALEDDEPYHLYVHIDGDDSEQYSFWAYEMDFSATPTDDRVVRDGSTTLEFESDRTDEYDVNVTADGLTENALEEIFDAHPNMESHDDGTVTLVDVGNAAALSADFTDVAFGEYEFTFDVADTVDEDTATIEVTEDNEDYAVVDIEETTQGGIANVSLEVTDSDSAAVVLGDAEDHFESAVELEDIEDEEVVLQFNTHLATGGDAWTVHDDSNASVADGSVTVDTLLDEDEPFPAHDWGLSVGDELAGDVELAQEYDRDVLLVQEWATIGDASIHTAPAADDVSDADALAETTLTSTGTVADADELLLTVDEFGAEGALMTLDDGVELADEGYVLEIEERDAGPIGDAHVWDSSADAGDDADELELDLLTAGDAYDDELVFAVDYESDAYETDLSTGDSYDVTFTVTEDNVYVEDEDDELERTAAFELVDRELELDAIESVPAHENVTTTGTTTVAPGTELDATVDSPVEEGRFIQVTDATVSEGAGDRNEFAAEFDFSVADPGVTFDLIVEDLVAPDDVYDVREDITIAPEEDEHASYRVDVDAPTTVMMGDTATLEVTVTNAGEDKAPSSYSVSIDGEPITEDGTELELEPGESVTDSHELDTAVEGDIEWEVLTDHDDESGTVTVTGADEDDMNAADDAAGDDEADDGEDEAPGFGVTATVVALLVIAFAAGRYWN